MVKKKIELTFTPKGLGYLEGQKAFDSGLSLNNNPYKDGEQKEGWDLGWNECKDIEDITNRLCPKDE